MTRNEKSTMAKQSSEMLWQQRQGHLSTSGMRTLAKDSPVTRFDVKQTINWISVKRVKEENFTNVPFPQVVQQE